ncbi:transcriptional regulator BetI, partial [Mesorhizobium sp. M7A.F.Ca.CA.001.04.1.1]
MFLLIDASIKNNPVFSKDHGEMPKIGMEPLRRKALIDAT